MHAFWNFPAAAGGMINSINNAGIETFRGNEIDSLTREICQNSLDAIKDETKPVVVEFNRFMIPTDKFPNKEEFLSILNRCEVTWKDKNDKSEQFIKQAKQMLNGSEISFLRISDFNTKGLEGAKTGKLGTPWSSLVREAGSSNKGDSSGGSFGIGKSAPFANSKLRTLFYASQDQGNYQSYIGVANIMSYKKNEELTTLGTGYFTDNSISNAIEGQLHIDSTFIRNDSGTDIYVAAFDPNSDWKQTVQQSILKNFFITIWQKKLIVKIEDNIISHENIAALIKELDDSVEVFNHVKRYFQVLTDPQAISIPYPKKVYKTIGTFEEGEATLYIMQGDDLNRKVLMTRKAGMRLFEQNRISGSISFTGLLIITGRQMNAVFKQMENPAHNEWQPSRYEDNSKIAEKAFKDLKSFIKESVHEQFQNVVTDSMDAIGLSDFLPDTSLLEGTGADLQESLNIKIKSVLKKKKQKVKKKPKKKQQDQSAMEELIGIIDGGDEGGTGKDDGTNGGSEGQGGGAGNPNPDFGEGGANGGDNPPGNETKEKNKFIETTVKQLCLSKDNGLYRVVVKAPKGFEKGRLEFKALGEQSEVKIPVKQLTGDGLEEISINNNTVRFKNKGKQKQIALNVEIDYEAFCRLEVSLYEI
ncbi:hypothetical protein ACQKM9_20895 [Viridibacillus sp. NPDC093762]|uniref:hypothetical protein n=1 Tax=Viridibacillus sp. NPDC093762 TaxID=3390720 RepID=UPI003D065B59